MKPTTVHLHPGFSIARVDERIFGGFLEHLGRAVYGGVYDPNSPHADEHGFRSDVIEALGRLRLTVMRYPGGNFASGYHWMDGVGPRDQRPTVRDLAWQSIEPNQFGTDEFLQLCRKMDWTPMLTVNLGTGTPEEARSWVEYCNGPTGSKYADLRAAHGFREPHAVKLWCLGNEMDGEWQLGHLPADQYASCAAQAAKLMKDVDRSMELVACGSSMVTMPTYLEWDRKVLEGIGDVADYLSLHRYVGNADNDTLDFLAISNSVDRQIEDADAVCRFVQAKRRGPKRPFLCFDEWNVWYRNKEANGEGQFAPPLLEEDYNLEDALVVAGFLHCFLRHADVVKIANLAQIVNVAAPIRTRGDRLLVQAIFHPLEMWARRREGVSLRVMVDGPGYRSRQFGEANFVDASAILGNGRLHLFLTNRNPSEAANVRVELADLAVSALESGELLTGPGPGAANSFEHPNVVRSQPFREVSVADHRVEVVLSALAFSAMTFKLA